MTTKMERICYYTCCLYRWFCISFFCINSSETLALQLLLKDRFDASTLKTWAPPESVSTYTLAQRFRSLRRFSVWRCMSICNGWTNKRILFLHMNRVDTHSRMTLMFQISSTCVAVTHRFRGHYELVAQATSNRFRVRVWLWISGSENGTPSAVKRVTNEKTFGRCCMR